MFVCSLQLRMALLKLQESTKHDELLFWGRIKGITQDYYIALGLNYKDYYNFPYKKFYYATSLDYTFAPMPQPNEQNKKDVDERDTMFFGDPEKVLIEVKPPEEDAGNPDAGANEEDLEAKAEAKKEALEESVEEKPVLIPKNFTELDRLSYVVAAIENDTHVVPLGAFKLFPNHELHRNPHFKGIAKTGLKSKEKYQHFRNVQDIEKKALLDKPESIFHEDLLDPISNDLPKGAWSLQTDSMNTVVRIRSLVWPGYVGYHVADTNNFGGAYFGNGIKNKDLAFMIQLYLSFCASLVRHTLHCIYIFLCKLYYQQINQKQSMIGTPFVSRDEILNKRIANRDKRPWEQTVLYPYQQQRNREWTRKDTKGLKAHLKEEMQRGIGIHAGQKKGGHRVSLFLRGQTLYRRSGKLFLTSWMKRTWYSFNFMITAQQGDHVAGQTIRTQADFDVAKGVTSYVGKAQDGTIADSVEQRVVGTSYSLIGRKMLGAMKSLKYAEATESDVEKEDNFRISGKRMQDEDDTKGLYYNGPIKAKNNYYGIGYESDGLEGNDEADAFDHMTGTIRKKREIISMDPYEDDTGYNNIEFNEEEIEATINPAKKKTGRQKIFESDFKIPFKEFEVDGSLKMKGHTHALPEVPADFDMFSRKKSATGKPVSLPRTRMDPDRRSTLLGEQKIQQAPRLETQRKFVQPKVEEFSESDIVIELPFSKNSEKMGRFKAYIAENKGQKVAGAVSANVFCLLNNHNVDDERFRDNQGEKRV
eukprot:TRINITY_DN1229_c0_g1_i1.p3 TRINITY_DN1229_c0_g1~~TRINITY_DN1229_c0_g1_i1.p3  ORF type:complete len:759 (-),score=89.09 TRINITY_DN1229_c0_g1_i1:9478-11754(-)